MDEEMLEMGWGNKVPIVAFLETKLEAQVESGFPDEEIEKTRAELLKVKQKLEDSEKAKQESTESAGVFERSDIIDALEDATPKIRSLNTAGADDSE